MSQDPQSQSIESATTALGEPDSKTRRYDRQLRLWASSGQAALESARVLLLTSTSTSAQILKTLVLPGVGHYTILGDEVASVEDVGGNFFLETGSVGKVRAEECVRLLGEMNDGVDGVAKVQSIESVLTKDPEYLMSFTLIISHNLHPRYVQQISDLLLKHEHSPTYILVRSAGFLADFFIQFREHTVVDSHAETLPSLRIDKPFPALLEHATKLNLEGMDDTDHGHVPYVVLLVRAMAAWKKENGNAPPTAYAQKQAFKTYLTSLQRKPDEENFEEALAQAYRAWTPTTVPSEIKELFALLDSNEDRPEPFYHLLWALREFVKRDGYGDGCLPLSSTLPDMKASTAEYIHLQGMYKKRAEEEKTMFVKILREREKGIGEEMISEFVRNAHALRVLRGEGYAAFDGNSERLVQSLQSSARETAVHLALSALDVIRLRSETETDLSVTVSEEELKAEVMKLLGKGAEVGEEEMERVYECIGEVVRSPLPTPATTASFLGGLVAQESIKMITRQYVPVKGCAWCVVDLVGSWAGVIG